MVGIGGAHSPGAVYTALLLGRGRCAVPPIVPTIRAPARPASGFVTGRALPKNLGRESVPRIGHKKLATSHQRRTHHSPTVVFSLSPVALCPALVECNWL